MENFIQLQGQKIPLTDEQIEQIRNGLGASSVKLVDIKVGNTFKIGEHEFVVLERFGDTTAVILKNLLAEGVPFGTTNDYKTSYAKKICDNFGKEIEDIVGEGNLVTHMVDLTADDGLKDYGTIEAKMSLLTANRARKYVDILDKHKIESWWWLATAYSTPTHGSNNWTKCVSPSGNIYRNVYGFSRGVRPFCILKSNIFVSL